MAKNPPKTAATAPAPAPTPEQTPAPTPSPTPEPVAPETPTPETPTPPAASTSSAPETETETVEARVLVDGQYGKANSIVRVSWDVAASSDELDANEDAVAYAKAQRN